MAEGVLFDFAGEIIKKLGSRALQEIGVWWGVNDELMKLEETVSSIRDVLLDAEEQESHSHQVKGWLKKLQEVVYDADDLLDDIATEALRRQVMTGNRMAKEVSLFFSHSNQLDYGYRMGYRVKAIRQRLDDIKANGKFHLEVRKDERRLATKVRDTDSSVPEVVIGREEDKRAVIEFLLAPNSEENVSIISIVGIGGLGKTTLAQLIFNDKQVSDQFEFKKWVCISDPFDVKNILGSIMGTKSEDYDLETLNSEVGKKINGKKYFLVLDDLWNDNREKWDSLKKLLIGGANGSKILVTTRSRKVAKLTSMKEYALEGLSELESWCLFSRVVSKSKQEIENDDVKNVGMKIVEKCAGVPLAIKTIASVLYYKDARSEWSSYLGNEMSKISQDENDILPTLRLSYNSLPSHLKHCFAYCALFPKDTRIDVKNLIHLWMSQGFIIVESSNSSKSLEDIGVEYFMELWWRSFFQEVERDEFGSVQSCKMHDLMHELATLVAGAGIIILNEQVKSIENTAFHVAITCSRAMPLLTVGLSNAVKLRSFLCPDNLRVIHKVGAEFMFSNFTCSRAFVLPNLITKIPSSIKNLKHLRYLDVSRNMLIETLPNSISKLQNLQVLNVSKCWSLKSLPKDIKKLINLRHLYCEDCRSLGHMPSGLGQLTSLQTLSLFVVGKDEKKNKHGRIDELNQLNSLRGSVYIRIYRKSELKASAANLKEKQHLQSLMLDWSGCDDDDDDDDEEMSLQNLQPHTALKELKVDGYSGMRVSTWLSALTNLVHLEIRNCKRCQYLPSLHQIPTLESLGVSGLYDLEYIEISGGEATTSTFFPSLKSLGLLGCPKLMGWRKKIAIADDDDDSDNDSIIISLANLPQFARLSEFVCWDCPKLNWLPLFPSLDKSLIVSGISVQFLEFILNITTSISSSSSAMVTPALCKLKNLEIGKMEDLESVPAGLQHLTSLQLLSIKNCPNLSSLLPQDQDQMLHRLTSMRELSIYECPKLKERYGNKFAQNWHTISHILNIKFDDTEIQREGQYLLKLHRSLQIE